MKTKSSIILTALWSLAVAGVSSGATTYVTNPVIYVAGSTAFAPADNLALDNYAVNNGYTLVASTGSTNPVSAKALLYKRQTATGSASSTTIKIDIINVHQTGSEIAVASAAGQALIPFLGNDATGLLTDATGTYTNNQQALIITSPVWQLSSRYHHGAYNGVTYGTLTEVLPTNSTTGIAAQIWGWSGSSNLPVSAQNITWLQARYLFQKGSVPLSFLTGNAADTNSGVWLVGRDIDAGARAATLAEIGSSATSNVVQYQVNTNGGVVSLSLQAASTNSAGVPSILGNGGYSSASSQLTAVKNPVPANLQVNGSNSPYATNYLIQYNAYAQTVGVTNNSGAQLVVPLNNNGVPISYDNVINGAYSFWTYEHLYLVPGTKATLAVKTVASSIANFIGSQPSATLQQKAGQGYLNVNDLNVTRSSDGGVISLK